MTEVDRLATRLFHGRLMKREFERVVRCIDRISPEFSLTLSTILRDLVFPLRPLPVNPPAVVRDDLDVYAPLFVRASENFTKTVSAFQAETTWSRGRVFNNLFESVDAELYYSMIRLFKPCRIVEIGAGNSTWFARDALRANGVGKLMAIDPSPRLALPRDCQIDRRFLEQVDLSLFRELGENDILFIDASHTRQEALYETQRIYPELRAGVFIHHHDISFPFVPTASIIRALGNLGEQPVVLDFLVAHADSYEVYTSSSFVTYEQPDLVTRLVPSSTTAAKRMPSSLWIRKSGA